MSPLQRVLFVMSAGIAAFCLTSGSIVDGLATPIASTFGGAALSALVLSLALRQAVGPGGGYRRFEMISPPQLLDIMKRKGLDADLYPSGRSILWKLSGVKAVVSIHKDGDSLKFSIGFRSAKANAEDIDRWHRENRSSRTFIDSEGDPVLEMDLSLEGGVREGRIVDFLDACPTVLAGWVAAVLN
jgi:hypothetical protein